MHAQGLSVRLALLGSGGVQPCRMPAVARWVMVGTLPILGPRRKEQTRHQHPPILQPTCGPAQDLRVSWKSERTAHFTHVGVVSRVWDGCHVFPQTQLKSVSKTELTFLSAFRATRGSYPSQHCTSARAAGRRRATVTQAGPSELNFEGTER